MKIKNTNLVPISRPWRKTKKYTYFSKEDKIDHLSDEHLLFLNTNNYVQFHTSISFLQNAQNNISIFNYMDISDSC